MIQPFDIDRFEACLLCPDGKRFVLTTNLNRNWLLSERSADIVTVVADLKGAVGGHMSFVETASRKGQPSIGVNLFWKLLWWLGIRKDGARGLILASTSLMRPLIVVMREIMICTSDSID